MDIGFAASSLADEDKLDEASLAQADAYITTGAGLDTISRLLNPRYKDWSSPQQQVYRAYLQGQIELRKTPTSQGNETFTSALAGESQAQKIPPEAIPFPSSEAETPKSRQPLFTLAQVIDLLHLLYDPGRSFADGTILRTRREVGRLTKE